MRSERALLVVCLLVGLVSGYLFGHGQGWAAQQQKCEGEAVQWAEKSAGQQAAAVAAETEAGRAALNAELLRHKATSDKLNGVINNLQSRLTAVTASTDKSSSSTGLNLNIREVEQTPIFASPASSQGSDRHVCIVIRTMPSHLPNKLLALLYSLAAQTAAAFDAFIIDTAQSGETIQSRHERLTKAVTQLNDPRFHISPTTRANSDPADYGYHATDRERKRLVDAAQPRGEKDGHCNYFLFTNGDNNYHVEYLKQLQEFMKKGFTIASTSFVHHDQYGIRYIAANLTDSEEMDGQIDLGCSVMEGLAVSEIAFTDVANGPEQWKYWNADYKYHRAIIQRKDTTMMILDEPLFFHQ